MDEHNLRFGYSDLMTRWIERDGQMYGQTRRIDYDTHWNQTNDTDWQDTGAVMPIPPRES